MLVQFRSQRLFRPARVDHAARLHAIREAAFAPIFAAFEAELGPTLAPEVMPHIRAGQAAQLDTYLAGPPGVTVFSVEEAGAPVAFCTTAVDTSTGVGEIGLNAVHPDHQRGGVGGWMYERALAHLKAEGMRVASVGTGGDAAHASARSAYARAGFVAAIPMQHLYRPL